MLDETDREGSKNADGQQIVKKEATSPPANAQSTNVSDARRWMSFHDVTQVNGITLAETVVDVHTFALQWDNFMFLHAMARHQESSIYKSLDVDIVDYK